MELPIDGCDFCGGQLDVAYTPPDTGRGAAVCVCRSCGLVQTIFSSRRPAEKLRLLSSGAQWGNVRHGKRLRMEQLSKFMEERVDWATVRSALDVGSNRGDFVRWLRARNADCEIVAVEPDREIVDSYRAIPSELILTRFEDAALPCGHFDLLHCCHTLEHADSAAAMVVTMNQLLKPGGTLFLEVPNIEAIGLPHVVEEFFIDKHSFHFSRGLLCDFIAGCGFTIERGQHDNDPFHVTILAKKHRAIARKADFPGNENYAKKSKNLLGSYAGQLNANRARLRTVAARISQLCGRQKVAIWGAGRLFDALVQFGGLDPSQISCLVDQYLHGLVETSHGLQICRPEELKLAQPQVLIVLARNSSPEILSRARQLGVKNAILFSDLMQS